MYPAPFAYIIKDILSPQGPFQFKKGSAPKYPCLGRTSIILSDTSPTLEVPKYVNAGGLHVLTIHHYPDRRFKNFLAPYLSQ